MRRFLEVRLGSVPLPPTKRRRGQRSALRGRAAPSCGCGGAFAWAVSRAGRWADIYLIADFLAAAVAAFAFFDVLPAEKMTGDIEAATRQDFASIDIEDMVDR
jgi:hypothetical protein